MSYIINIEGTDGCGKRTQSEMLFKELQKRGYKVLLQSFPNYESESSHPVKMYLRGEFGNTADSLDSYQASSLYAIDRLCTMKKLECEDNILILDRYTNSNMMYQSTKIEDPIERSNFEKWVLDFEHNVLKIPRPDLVIFLDMPAQKSCELAKGRANYKTGDKNDIHEEDKEYLAHCYKVGKEIAKKYGWNEICCVNERGQIRTIDEIHKDVIDIVMKNISNK